MKSITRAQRKLLERLVDNGGYLVLSSDPYRNKGRVLDGMANDGLVLKYQSEWEITEAGRAALAEATAKDKNNGK